MGEIDDMTPNVYYIDLFCGAGGTLSGIISAKTQSKLNIKVIACVNHDVAAIRTYKANYSKCLHLTEDIRDWEVIFKLRKLVDDLRKKEPNCIINIWASLECTHFSKAKGGMSRDADSRTLGDHLYYYINILNPDYLYIENVTEFLTWCPVDDQGKPIKELYGIDYERWRESIKKCGYDYDYRILNSADFGARTSRERYFGIFAKKGLPISFPKPTHIKRSKRKGSNLPTWKPVKSLLDLENEGVSIFGKNGNNKPYSDKTIERVYYGCIKHVSDGVFLKRYNGGITTNKSGSVYNPLGAILTANTHSIVQLSFLTSYYGNGGSHSIDEPCNTITTKDRFAAHFLHYDYSSTTNSPLDSPAGCITTKPKHALVTTKWLYDTQFKNIGKSLDHPCPTLIARMDKKPMYLASANKYGVDESIYNPNDSPIRSKLRYFMRCHGIKDVKIRALTVDELKVIQGFPKEYKLIGKKEDQLKFIGNSVAPVMAQALVEENYNAVVKYLIAA